MESEKNLANFIRQHMKSQNLSVADVARRADNEISPTTITKILNGEVSKSGTKTLALIARGLGIPEMDLFRAANGEDVSRPLHHQIYAERFDAQDFTETEWQFLELYFKDKVDTFKEWKNEKNDAIEKLRSERPKPPIALIDSPLRREQLEREEIKRTLDRDRSSENAKPRKKKA